MYRLYCPVPNTGLKGLGLNYDAIISSVYAETNLLKLICTFERRNVQSRVETLILCWLSILHYS